MHTQKKHFIALGLALTAVTSMAVLAAEQVILNDTFDVPQNSQIYINVPVGQLKLVAKKTDQVDLNIVVKDKDTDWFDSNNLKQAELSKDVRGNKVYLQVDLEDTKQEWVVTVPMNADLTLNMGVGQVDISGIQQNLELDVGVGTADINLAVQDYSEINLKSGVGDVDLAGFQRVAEERNLVSKEIEWRGEGQYRLNINMGVGEAEVSYQ